MKYKNLKMILNLQYYNIPTENEKKKPPLHKSAWHSLVIQLPCGVVKSQGRQNLKHKYLTENEEINQRSINLSSIYVLDL